MTTGVLVPTNGPAALALAAELGGTLTAVGLEITDPSLPFESWENLGRCISFAGNAWQWWVGDWIRIGETLYGEDAAQGVDDPASKYDVMRRVTGVEQQTLLNVASVARKVPIDLRRQELRFSHHAVVAPLDRDEQIHWLQRAIDERLSVADLRQAIRDSKDPEPDPDPDPARALSGDPTLAERLEEAARVLWSVRQQMDNGAWAPETAWSQLGVALGEIA